MRASYSNYIAFSFIYYFSADTQVLTFPSKTIGEVRKIEINKELHFLVQILASFFMLEVWQELFNRFNDLSLSEIFLLEYRL